MRRMRFVPIDAFNMFAGANVGAPQSHMMIHKTSSPQKIPISMGKPMSLSPTGKECIQFPYGTSVITTINGMQGVSIPSSVIYNNCY
jgi:hypothetical protein